MARVQSGLLNVTFSNVKDRSMYVWDEWSWTRSELTAMCCASYILIFLWHNVIKDSVFAISLPLGLSVLQDFVNL